MIDLEFFEQSTNQKAEDWGITETSHPLEVLSLPLPIHNLTRVLARSSGVMREVVEQTGKKMAKYQGYPSCWFIRPTESLEHARGYAMQRKLLKAAFTEKYQKENPR